MHKATFISVVQVLREDQDKGSREEREEEREKAKGEEGKKKLRLGWQEAGKQKMRRGRHEKAWRGNAQREKQGAGCCF